MPKIKQSDKILRCRLNTVYSKKMIDDIQEFADLYYDGSKSKVIRDSVMWYIKKEKKKKDRKARDGKDG